ncbi:hypothetical protein C0992_008147, partial [Termitomyces sp. T32_za158]
MSTVPSTVTTVKSSVKEVPAAFKHPLDPLTPDEITTASFAIRQYVAKKTEVKAIKFITLYLLPPPKKAVLAHLGIPTSPGAKSEAPVPIIRQAESDVDTFDKLPETQHAQISPEELIIAEEVVRKDPVVQKLAAD